MEPVVRLRPQIAALAAYSQGRAAPAGGFKLSSNENPFPPLPSVAARVAETLDFNRYPDGSADLLRDRLAARHGLESNQVHVGAGSISLLTQLITATAGPGDEVVLAWRSFEAYPGLIAVAGATAVPVPNRADASHDIDAMIAAIGPATRAVLVCSPNNPTSTVVTREEFDRLVAAVPSDVLVVLDEAYHEFGSGSGGVDGDVVAGRVPNVVVLRTFSKAWGLAGLRIGYALGHPSVLDAARSCAIALSVTAQAQAAALISLDHESELRDRVAVLIADRDAAWRALVDLGLAVPQPWGNFVWLPTGHDTARAADVFHEHGVAVRPFPGDGIRITIAEPESVTRVLAAAAALASSERAGASAPVP